MKLNRNIFIVLIFMIPIMILSLYYHFNIMDEKSFATPDKIIAMINGTGKFVYGTNNIFAKCASFYKHINIFHFTTIFQWTLAINVFFNFVLAIFIIKFKKLSINETIFIYNTFIIGERRLYS